MNLIKKLACVMLCVATLLLAVKGQDKTPQQALPGSGALDPAVQKVLVVLNQVLEQQKSFADNKLRIAIRMHIADMLWGLDEQRARRLFEEAIEALAEANFAEQAALTSSSLPSAAYLNLAFSSIRTVIRRDPALAAKLGERLVDIPLNPSQRSHGLGGDLRYSLATSLISEDPQRAAQVAKPFADRGELNKLIPFIRFLRTRDAKAADELFLQAFERARVGEPSGEDIRWMASYVFPGFGEGVISFSSGGDGQDKSKPISLGRAVVEQFLDLAYDRLPVLLEQSLSNEDDRSFLRFPYDYTTARLLASQFDLLTPDRAQAFRARLEAARRLVPVARQRTMMIHEPGTVGELLARADRLNDPRDKDSLYLKASEQAIYGGKVDEASVIVEKIVDETIRITQRGRIINSSFDDIFKLLQAGDFDKAERMIAQISFGRMWMFRSLIGGLLRKDKPRALELLKAEYDRSDKLENRTERAVELMTLAGVYTVVDANRAFEEMTIAVREFNRAGFTPEWEKVQERETTSKGSNQNSILRVNIGLGGIGFNDFDWLGESDFDRALGVARQMEMPEAAALAQLAVCRGALHKLQPAAPPKPVSSPKQQEAGKARQQ